MKRLLEMLLLIGAIGSFAGLLLNAPGYGHYFLIRWDKNGLDILSLELRNVQPCQEPKGELERILADRGICFEFGK